MDAASCVKPPAEQLRCSDGENRLDTGLPLLYKDKDRYLLCLFKILTCINCMAKYNFCCQCLMIFKNIHYLCRSMKKEAKDIIAKVVPYFRTQPIDAAYLFGSYSRGEERKDSDVDFLVVLDKTQHVGLFKLSQMNIDLENLLDKKVDLISNGSLKRNIASQVNHDKILIYERSRS